ncbi:MAG TPA: glycosyltransferase family 2 protein [Bryobacteraceae bacterium]|nr:glycosyltransferase family 2 protein [Bryobacteraceae bacterium]
MADSKQKQYPQAGSVPVSVLIPAKNEEENIQACLDSVRWANDVVVVDSKSTDRTCEMSTAAGARVIQFHYVPGEMKKKNWALSSVDFLNSWILILDADERITPELAEEIARSVHDPKGCPGFYINRRFFFLNRFIRHAGYYPSWNLRLLKRGSGMYEDFTGQDTGSGDNEVHEHIILDGNAGYLNHPMDHFAFPTIDHFLQKHIRYSNWEARVQARLEERVQLDQARTGISRSLELKRFLKNAARKFPFPHWLRFAYHYFIKRGFLDGKEGYVFCHLLAEYEFWIAAKRFELGMTPLHTAKR